MPRPQLVDSTVLEAALVGLEHKKSELDQQITAVRKLGGRAHQLTVRLCRRPTGGNVLSPAARKRIAQATRRRWAA